jgi:hypothetical protein
VGQASVTRGGLPGRAARAGEPCIQSMRATAFLTRLRISSGLQLAYLNDSIEGF